MVGSHSETLKCALVRASVQVCVTAALPIMVYAGPALSHFPLQLEHI